MLSNKAVLVTGGSGFIGSHLVDKLIELGAKVYVIDKAQPKYRNNKAIYYIMNLASERINEIFEKNKFDTVIHLAAQTSVNISVENPKDDGITNILGTLNLIENCKKYGICNIIASSSAAVYGEPEYLPVDENHPLNPLSPYALSKHTMEAYIKLSGLDYIIFRFSNVYGPRQSSSMESGVISIFTNNILANRSINVYGDGEQSRDFIYVQDIVENIIKCIDFNFKNETINLSTQTSTTLNSLIKLLQKITNSDCKINYLQSRDGDIKQSILGNSKMKKYDLKADTNLEDGLKNTVEFYKNQQNNSNKNNVLIIIPARGGSVGIPRKNLRNLNGKPLIAYSIENALNSKYKPDVYVSSDDDEILYISEKIGALGYKRDAKISDGATTLDPVIYDAYKNISEQNNKQYSLIITLQPTSPLLKTDSLDKAIEKMLSNSDIDTLISAKDTTHLSWSKSDDGKYVPNYKARVNRQFLPPVYTETGGFLITRPNIITKDSRIGNNVELFVLKNEEELIDIDTYEDFNLANYYLSRKNILFVVSGYKEIGFGHVYRALLLANNITNHNIKFLVTKNSQEGFEKIKQYKYESYIQTNDNIQNDIDSLKPDIIINDILNTEENYIKILKQKNMKVINFEDLGDGAKYADLVINALYSKSNNNSNTLWGSQYFCARDEFLLSKTKEITKNVKNILITFGGTDPNNLTLKVLQSIYKYCLEQDINIDVILGLGYKNVHSLKEYDKINIYKDIKSMSDFMSKADIVFTACGRTVYEVACIGTPCIVMAQNERELKHEFASEPNGFINLKLGENVKNSEILQKTKMLTENENLRFKMNKKMLNNNLKKGTQRVVSNILSVISGDK